jgi:hypothetical protein
MIKKFNYTKDRADNTYFEMQVITSNSEANAWIAPWPGYAGTMNCGRNENNVYVCSNGLQVNLSNYDVFGITEQGIVRPNIAAFVTEDGLVKKRFDGNTIGLGLTIIPINENELQAVTSSPELTGGMFTRMFYMQDHGLKYFKLFNHQRGLTGTDIYTYKIDWEGKNTTIIQGYVDTLNKISSKEEIEKTPLNNSESS